MKGDSILEQEVPMTTLRQEVRDFLNKRVGSIIAVQDFSKPTQVTHYLSILHENGNLERTERGKYKVLKKKYSKTIKFLLQIYGILL